MMKKRINIVMKYILSGVLLCLLSGICSAQPTRSVRSILENRLTELVHPSYYTQYFSFSDTMLPERFTVIQEQNSQYVVYDAKLSQIQSMDIVLRDTAVALVLTFHRPLEVTIQDDFHGKPTAVEERQTLTFPLRHYQEAQHVQRAFQNTDNMLDFRIRKQHSDSPQPEMIVMPEIHSRKLWLGKYPVTVQEYRAYCRTQQQPMPPAPPWGWHADHPIVGISWQEAKDYTQWLSRQTGFRYDLPTREIWQYAALANGKKTLLEEVAWWGENAGSTTQSVGQKLPNGLGLYDMLGNIWEWLDGSDTQGYRTAAGGSWDSHFEQCQWNSTASWQQDEKDLSLGFRLVRYP